MMQVVDVSISFDRGPGGIFLGKFDPKAMNNFYDNIQPGPVVPPKPGKKGENHKPPHQSICHAALEWKQTWLDCKNCTSELGLQQRID